MSSFRPGEVLLILFPFTDMAGAKRRPALVLLDAGDDDVLVARITTEVYRVLFEGKSPAAATDSLMLRPLGAEISRSIL